LLSAVVLLQVLAFSPTGALRKKKSIRARSCARASYEKLAWQNHGGKELVGRELCLCGFSEHPGRACGVPVIVSGPLLTGACLVSHKRGFDAAKDFSSTPRVKLALKYEAQGVGDVALDVGKRFGRSDGRSKGTHRLALAPVGIVVVTEFLVAHGGGVAGFAIAMGHDVGAKGYRPGHSCVSFEQKKTPGGMRRAFLLTLYFQNDIGKGVIVGIPESLFPE
jgi:hypothetical protein